MADLVEHLDAMRVLIEGGPRGENRVQFVALMRAHMISVVTHLLSDGPTAFLDADLFLSASLAFYAKSRRRC